VSSLVRRLEIRMLKAGGYTREKWILVKNRRGDLAPQTVKRGGEITDRDDNPIGRRWPRRTTAIDHSVRSLLKSGRPQRALRRSKRSQEWLEAKAAARGAK
jgi:hypothetical protein